MMKEQTCLWTVWAAACFFMTSLAGQSLAGEITVVKDESSGWDVYTLQQGETQVRVVPSAGANAYSMIHRDVEYFRTPDELKKLPGVGYGNPILYPTPNRVRGAEFSFRGRTYRFPKNGRGNFIHGLVHSEEFTVEKTESDQESATMVCRLDFAPGGRPFELFPIEHVFRISITVREGLVGWKYEIDNRDGKAAVPFGVAFHPYVKYQNSREQTYLRVPAKHLMEAEKQLPTGRLLDLEGHPLDARTPRSLLGYKADDVFFGMTRNDPASVEFREVKRRIIFRASPEFTHLVVWTPDRPYFGIENQTCSTDAHNLSEQGKGDVAHLQVCSPGQSMTGWVEYDLRGSD